jgi:lipid II:glycine glycyltransferase (peptidoglycan interpeptide bridge formation enzyme)
MLVRPLRVDERDQHDQVVTHPLQSWAWGEFRKATGTAVERIGFFDDGKLKNAIQVFFHKVHLLPNTIGYFPKGTMPDERQLSALKQLAKQHNALCIKMEPNVARQVDAPSGFQTIEQFLEKNGARPGKPLFTRYTFQLDLTKPEDELFSQLNGKTRYNVNVAVKKGVTVVEQTDDAGLAVYLQLLRETTTRQGFYAHTPEYFEQMWSVFGQSGMLRLFVAYYEDKPLVSWIMFIFNGVLYYPYGASSAEHRDAMASNLMMWEMIRFGKAQGCVSFDMWGALGPEPDAKHPWFGFHRFKKGFGGELVEFLGTYDYVLQPQLYSLYRLADDWRWKWLRLKAKFQR